MTICLRTKAGLPQLAATISLLSIFSHGPAQVSPKIISQFRNLEHSQGLPAAFALLL